MSTLKITNLNPLWRSIEIRQHSFEKRNNLCYVILCDLILFRLIMLS